MKELAKEFISDFAKHAKEVKKGKIKQNIPNMLTFTRALAPLIIIPTVLFGKIYFAIIELVFFAFTDFIDGKLARKFNCVTEFGLRLDAACNKIFAFGVMIPALIKYPVLLINLMLELCIIYINVLSASKSNHPESNLSGKIKTTFLSITLIFAYVPEVPNIYVLLLSIITSMLQVTAFVQYKERISYSDNEKKK